MSHNFPCSYWRFYGEKAGGASTYLRGFRGHAPPKIFGFFECARGDVRPFHLSLHNVVTCISRWINVC